MILVFRVYRMKESSAFYEYYKTKEFIIVGEEGKFLKVHPIDDGISVLESLPIDEFALMFSKTDFELLENKFVEFDIPQKYLTLDIIDTIQRLNYLA